ncbi:MAG: hypothetical protein AB8U48_00575 [Anaplasma ovis]
MYAVAVMQLLQQYQVVLAAFVLFVIFSTAAGPVRGAGFGHMPTAFRKKSVHGQTPPAPVYHTPRSPAEAPIPYGGGTGAAPPDPGHERICHADDQTRTTAALPQATPAPYTMCGGGTHPSQKPAMVGHIPALSHACSAKIIAEPSAKCVLYSLEAEPDHHELAKSAEEAMEVVDIAHEPGADICEPALNEAQLCIVEEEAGTVDQEPFPKIEPANTLMCCITVDQVLPHSIAKMLQHG